MNNYRVMSIEYRDGQCLSPNGVPRVVDRAESAVELISRRDAHVGYRLRETPGSTATYSATYDEFRIEFPATGSVRSHVEYVRCVN